MNNNRNIVFRHMPNLIITISDEEVYELDCIKSMAQTMKKNENMYIFETVSIPMDLISKLEQLKFVKKIIIEEIAIDCSNGTEIPKYTTIDKPFISFSRKMMPADSFSVWTIKIINKIF